MHPKFDFYTLCDTKNRIYLNLQQNRVILRQQLKVVPMNIAIDSAHFLSLAAGLGQTFTPADLKTIFPEMSIDTPLREAVKVGQLTAVNGQYSFENAEKYQQALRQLPDSANAEQIFRLLYAKILQNQSITQAQAHLQNTLEANTQVLLQLTKDKDIRDGNWHEALAVITEALSNTVKVGRASIWRYNHKEHRIECLDLYEQDEHRHSSGVILNGTDFPAYFDGLTKELVIKADDAHTHHNTFEFSEVYLTPLNIGALLDVPFYIEGELGGVICFEHQGGARDWSFDEILFTTSVCAVISIAYQSLLRKQDQNIIIEYNNQLLTQNEELHQQQEEIMAQRDFIELKNKELAQANEKLQGSLAQLQESEEQIQSQNQTLQERDRQISSSINAALTIQRAFLPDEARMKSLLKDYFVLYRPRDVVSGDFYWIRKIENKIILAVADCTGHGVPGAFMSLIGVDLLDKIVQTWEIVEPSRILTYLHEEVRAALRQGETGNNNGMDIAILILERIGDTTKIIFSGAKANVFYIPNGSIEVQELIADRKSIGGEQNESVSFTNQELTLDKGSLLYMGTDGYADQNNVQRKRFGEKSLKELLNKNQQNTLSEQKEYLAKAIDEHQAGTTQRDDILILGLRL
jgi:serine phosphatase RsbU (regulator of sigma subunit)